MARVKDYAIVEFLGEEAVEVVPTKWLFGEGQVIQIC